jgi:hypothetical protein
VDRRQQRRQREQVVESRAAAEAILACVSSSASATANDTCQARCTSVGIVGQMKIAIWNPSTRAR